mmetsp:Transcript_28536/g.87383  ORF Transcript_28536/g.87383 Transcript_28536/m.87383 type:complete len:311 (-) Transcript_28536:947-1879(-)
MPSSRPRGRRRRRSVEDTRPHTATDTEVGVLSTRAQKKEKTRQRRDVEDEVRKKGRSGAQHSQKHPAEQKQEGDKRGRRELEAEGVGEVGVGLGGGGGGLEDVRLLVLLVDVLEGEGVLLDLDFPGLAAVQVDAGALADLGAVGHEDVGDDLAVRESEFAVFEDVVRDGIFAAREFFCRTVDHDRRVRGEVGDLDVGEDALGDGLRFRGHVRESRALFVERDGHELAHGVTLRSGLDEAEGVLHVELELAVVPPVGVGADVDGSEEVKQAVLRRQLGVFGEHAANARVVRGRVFRGDALFGHERGVGLEA